MFRGPLADPEFRPQFSGHETFPLRHLWLKKAFDAVASAPHGAPKTIFTAPEAIVTFGVGKNMVSSIRHWALTCRIICEEEDLYYATELGTFLFSDEGGADPFLESQATTWLLHWLIAGTPERSTTWYYAFNHLSLQGISHETLVNGLLEYCAILKNSSKAPLRASTATLKRDAECFFRSYVPSKSNKFSDDIFEPALVSLGLIREIGSKCYHFQRGQKATLPDGIFLFAVEEFWRRNAPGQNTLSVEALSYEPGSPGRVFKLDEDALVERLARIEVTSKGAYIWTDTAGVRNIARREERPHQITFLASVYDAAGVRSGR